MPIEARRPKRADRSVPIEAGRTGVAGEALADPAAARLV
jgi:hypothetical protein